MQRNRFILFFFHYYLLLLLLFIRCALLSLCFASTLCGVVRIFSNNPRINFFFLCCVYLLSIPIPSHRQQCAYWFFSHFHDGNSLLFALILHNSFFLHFVCIFFFDFRIGLLIVWTRFNIGILVDFSWQIIVFILDYSRCWLKNTTILSLFV